MTEATDTKRVFHDWEVRNRETDARYRGYRIGAGVTIVVAALLLLLTTLVIWPWVDRNVYLRDDRGLGDNFRTQMHPSRATCESIAETLYSHGLFVLEDESYKTQGWAPRSENAFYAGCTGSDWTRDAD
jgi:hypothetical protein